MCVVRLKLGAGRGAQQFDLVGQAVLRGDLFGHRGVNQAHLGAGGFDGFAQGVGQRHLSDAGGDLGRLAGRQSGIVRQADVGCAVDGGQLGAEALVAISVRQPQLAGDQGVDMFAVADECRHGDAP